MRLYFHSNFHCCVIIHYMNISSIIHMTSDELFPIGAIANSILLPNIHTYNFLKMCNSFILGIDLQVESLRHSISIYWGTYVHCQFSNVCQFTFHQQSRRVEVIQMIISYSYLSFKKQFSCSGICIAVSNCGLNMHSFYIS